jgi:hypothetical protein
MPSRIFPRRRRGQLGIESIVWWALFIVFALSISSFVLGFLQGVQPPPTKYFYVFPLAGSGTDVNNGIIGVPQMEKLYNQVRDVSFLLLGIVFMFAALTFVLENFNIMSPGTAWNIIAKSIFYVVMIWLLLWLYNGIAGGVSQLALYFDRLPDGSSAAETVWRKFSSLVFAPQGMNWLQYTGNIGNAILGGVTVPIIAIVAFTTAVIVWITSVGRIVILAAAVCALPLALIFDLIPPLKRFADTLFGIVIGLTFSPIIVAIMFNISVPIADAIVCTSSIPLFHILVYGAIISMGSVVIVAFAPMVGSAVSAATTTALSGAGALIASGMMIGQTAATGGTAFGLGAVSAARAGLPTREALKVGGITGLKGAGAALITTGTQVATGSKMPSAIGVVTPSHIAGETEKSLTDKYTEFSRVLTARLPVELSGKDKEDLRNQYSNVADNFLNMSQAEKISYLTNVGLDEGQARIFAKAVEADKDYYSDPIHKAALGFHLENRTFDRIFDKNSEFTVADVEKIRDYRGSTDGLKYKLEDRVGDLEKKAPSDEVDPEIVYSERNKVLTDIKEVSRVKGLKEKKVAPLKERVDALRKTIDERMRGRKFLKGTSLTEPIESPVGKVKGAYEKPSYDEKEREAAMGMVAKKETRIPREPELNIEETIPPSEALPRLAEESKPKKPDLSIVWKEGKGKKPETPSEKKETTFYYKPGILRKKKGRPKMGEESFEDVIVELNPQLREVGV